MPEFDDFCKNSIVAACMPPHSHLQPPDVGCFATLKKACGRQITGSLRLPINHIDKPEFIFAFERAHKEILSSSNIRSGFAATGPIPYDPSRVLSRLQIKLRTPTPPPQDTEAQDSAQSINQAFQILHKPHVIAQLESQAVAIRRFLQQLPE